MIAAALAGGVPLSTEGSSMKCQVLIHGAWLDAEFDDGLYDSPAALSDGIDCAHADRGPVTSPARIDGEPVHVNLIWIAAVRATSAALAAFAAFTAVSSSGGAS